MSDSFRDTDWARSRLKRRDELLLLWLFAASPSSLRLEPPMAIEDVLSAILLEVPNVIREEVPSAMLEPSVSLELAPMAWREE